jgi:hypothetical protein
MKNLIAVFRFGVVLSLLVNVFQVNSQISDNYYVIRDSLEAYYNAHPELKDEEDGDYSQFRRWQSFWQTRIYNGDSLLSGSFECSRRALEQFRKDRDNFNQSTIINSDWHCLGPNNIPTQNIGLVLSLYVDTVSDKTRNTIYIGSSTSGIWKTTNGGSNWHNVTDPSGMLLLGVTDITGDPKDGNIIYASTGGTFLGRDYSAGTGIIKSYDAGITWNQILPYDAWQHISVYRILVDPFNSKRIYALVDSSLLRSVDFGQHWEVIFHTKRGAKFIQGEFLNLRDIEMKPNDSNTLYLATDDRFMWSINRAAQIWKLTNVLSTDTSLIVKTRLDTDLPNPNDTIPSNKDTIYTERYELAVTSADPEAIYVECTAFPKLSGDKKLKIWKFENDVWHRKIDTSYYNDIGYFKNSFLVSPTDTAVVYAGGTSFLKFVNWHFKFRVPSGFNSVTYHDDTRYARIISGSSPGNEGKDDIIFAGNDGGLSSTNNGMNSWVNLNGNGLTITQFWGIGGMNSNPSILAGGSQDNSFYMYNSNTTPNWLHSFDGDNGDVIIDPLDSLSMLTSEWIVAFCGIALAKSTNGGQSWNRVSTNCSDWIPSLPVSYNMKNPKSVFFCFHDLFKSLDRGDTSSFFKIFIPFVDQSICDSCKDPVKALCISPSDSNRIYIGYNGRRDYYPGCKNCQQTKLIRSHAENGSLIWEDLTENLKPMILNYGITDIEVSTTNPDSVWVTFGGYLKENDNQRVIFSNNGGTSWHTDYSSGLPNLPVNCIEYMNDGGGRLFLGTDGGVYYRDKFLTAWEPFNTGMPLCIVNDLEISENFHTVTAGTYGRGIYQTDISCTYDSDPLVIGKNTTWTKDTVMDRSIEVDSTVTFTIKCKVKFPPSAKIFVHRGAKLVLDSGTLTNRCFNMWQGIEVWGNAKKRQNVNEQGLVWLKNGSIIENARIAITASQSDPNGNGIWGTGGGIIIGENSYFRNNFKSVELWSYPNDLMSEFQNVAFETTREYLDTNQSLPQDFISLCDVRGLKILGCKFRNLTVLPGEIPGSLDGRGIYSLNSTFSVDQYEYCPGQVFPCPDIQRVPSSFTGLYYGIRALTSDPTRYTRINRTKFDNNYRGVFLSAMDYSTVTQDTFYIPKGIGPGIDTCYGLFLDNCNQYQVEENVIKGKYFNGISSSADISIGMVINNSGTDVNEIYKNKFDSVKYAIIAQRLNRDPDGYTGLCMKCNQYSNTKYDEAVTLAEPALDWGIALNQGDSLSQTGPAGNRFSMNHTKSPINQEADIKNEGAYLKYYYNNNNLTNYRIFPDYVTVASVQRRPDSDHDYDSITSCPSHLTQGGGGSGEDEMKQIIVQNENTMDSLSSILSAIVDGGDTPTLNTNIALSTSNEAFQMYQVMLGNSPYLSDTVMKNAIRKEDVFPNVMMRDVLVANPQSSKSEHILHKLYQRFIPMSNSMMAEILENVNTISPKEAIETDINSHRVEKFRSFNNLIRVYLSDSVTLASRDSLFKLLSNDNSIRSEYFLAWELLSDRDTLKADSVLSSIPSSFPMMPAGMSLHENYLSAFILNKGLIRGERSINNLSSAEIATLNNLSTNASEPVKSLSRNALVAGNLKPYDERVIIPDETKSSNANHYQTSSSITPLNTFTLYPNPAMDFIVINYKIDDVLTIDNFVRISLINFEGKEMSNILRQKTNDQILIDLTAYTSGTYICTLFFKNTKIESKTFTVIR